MTTPLSPSQVAPRIGEHLPDAVTDFNESAVYIRSDALFQVASLLKEEFALDFLSSITAVDFIEHFELIYHLSSIKYNHSIVLRTRCSDRESPSLPSLVSLWQGADLQEREVYDLMGIAFTGHPNLKRIFLWDGFRGHPLRKDFGGGA
jgi:NADH-quinone oxidoreductase subunit C